MKTAAQVIGLRKGRGEGAGAVATPCRPSMAHAAFLGCRWASYDRWFDTETHARTSWRAGDERLMAAYTVALAALLCLIGADRLAGSRCDGCLSSKCSFSGLHSPRRCGPGSDLASVKIRTG